MKTVWKYELKVINEQTFNLPVGAQLLTVQVQYDTPCLWVLLDPDASREPVKIYTAGTGAGTGFLIEHYWIEQNNLLYVGTYQMRDGRLVFHVFVEVLS